MPIDPKVQYEIPILSLRSEDFQTQLPENTDQRYYFECLAATDQPNRNFFQFTDKTLTQLMESYIEGKTLTVNHDRYTGLGIGSTTDAIVINGALYVQAYIKRDYNLQGGSYGTRSTNDLIDAVADGFAKDVSVSVLPKLIECSICGNDYNDYENCNHYRGREYIVGEGENKKVEVCILIVRDCEASELSIVQDGADPNARIVKKAIDLYYDGSIDDKTLKQVQQKYSILGLDFDFIKSKSGTPKIIDPDKELDQFKKPGFSKPEPKGDNLMTPEQIATLQQLNATLQSNNDSLAGQIKSLSERSIELTTENANLRAEKTTIEAEKQIADNKLEELIAAKDKADKEIEELKQEISNNQLLVEDGREARDEVEQSYVEAFAKSQGEDCTMQDKERQADFAKTQPMKRLKEHIKSFEEIAEAKFGGGRKTRDDDENDETDNSSNDSVKGVGY